MEIVRQAAEIWNRGDLSAYFEYLDGDVVVRAAEGWPETAYHGKRAVQSFFEGYAETVGHDTVIEELRDAGETVVCRARAHVTGEQSGVEGDFQFSQLLTFRKGKVVLIEFFLGSPGSPRSRRAAEAAPNLSGR